MVSVAPWEDGHMGASAEAMVVGFCMVFVCVVGCELCVVGGTCNFNDLQLSPLEPASTPVHLVSIDKRYILP